MARGYKRGENAETRKQRNKQIIPSILLEKAQSSTVDEEDTTSEGDCSKGEVFWRQNQKAKEPSSPVLFDKLSY